MASTRPKRGFQQMSYKNMMESDSEDNDSASLVSDSSYKDLLERPSVEVRHPVHNEN
jgi:hypothetical protein